MTENDDSDLPNRTLEHLFRVESGRLVSVLTRIFGAHNMELAEDVVQDSFAEAVTHWTYQGIPDNPSAWLFRVAKNRALNILRKEKHKRQYSSQVALFLQSESTVEPSLDHLFSEKEIADDQLRMLFTCCSEGISEDSQVALALRTLCGFSIPEIARAFLTNEDNINKRLVRARKQIRDNPDRFEVPAGKELDQRQDVVLETMFLMFNEGYSALEGDDLIRNDLCEEAIRLTEIMASHPKILRKSNVFALLSLMVLNASRFKSRQDREGMPVELARQDRTLWDRRMINKGIEYLYRSLAEGRETVSRYQIMATISAHHCTAASEEATDWKSIIRLYDHLLQIDHSALTLLNRAVAISKVFDAKKAISELEMLKKNPVLRKYPYYFSVLGEFHMMEGDEAAATLHFKKALELTHNRREISLLEDKISRCVSLK